MKRLTIILTITLASVCIGYWIYQMNSFAAGVVDDRLKHGINITPTERILYKVETLRKFSSVAEKDTFRIYLTGDSIKNSQIRFQIIKKGGKIIFDEVFETTKLLDFGLGSNANDNAKDQYIKDRIGKFFNKDNFYQPAIAATEVFDEDYSKKETWDDILSDQTSIGFYYLTGEENGQRIAYSKKLQKVVGYYSCC